MLWYKVLVTPVTMSDSGYWERCTQIVMGAEEGNWEVQETGNISYQRTLDKLGLVDQEKNDCYI